MKSIWIKLSTCGVLVASLVSGCSSESSTNGASVTGRGTPACHSWQKSYCDYVAKCGLNVTRQECDDQQRGVTCRDDALATDCANKFNTNSCTQVPVGCDVSDLADRAPAIAACNAYLQTVCEADARCGGPAVETCVTELAAQIDCSTTIAYKLRFETCLSELASLSCDAVDLPSSCDLVLVSG